MNSPSGRTTSQMLQQIQGTEQSSVTEEGIYLPWNASVEALLAGWCDQAKSFEWMHTESSSHYDKKARRLMITVNIMVAVSGLSNIIAGNAVIGGIQLIWIFGALTVFTSIANMLQDKLAWQHQADMHKRQAALQSAIRRKLEEELSLPPISRRDCKTFLRFIRADINMTTQVNVRIPKHIRDLCYDRFHDVPHFDLPDICGHVEHTRIFINTTLNSTLDVNKLDSIDSCKSPLYEKNVMKPTDTHTQTQTERETEEYNDTSSDISSVRTIPRAVSYENVYIQRLNTIEKKRKIAMETDSEIEEGKKNPLIEEIKDKEKEKEKENE